MKDLTREHKAVFNFKNAAAQYRPAVEDEGSTYYTGFYDAFEGAVSNFILCELNIRQGERCDELDVFPDLKTHSLTYGEKLNNEGIEYLTTSKSFLDEFITTLGTQTSTDSDFQTTLNTFKQSVKEMLSQMEVKASDVEELNTKFDEVYATLAIGNSGTNLMNYLSDQVQDLIDVRSSTGRGAETNIAIWKVIGAAVALGIGVWIVYKCYYSPWRCSKKEKAIYNSILFTALVTAGACE